MKMDIYTVENLTYEGKKMIHYFKHSKTNPFGTTDSEYVATIKYDRDTKRTEFKTEVRPLNKWWIEGLKPHYSMTPKTKYTGHIELPDPPKFDIAIERETEDNSVTYDILKYVKKICDEKKLVPWFGDWTYTKDGAKTTFKLVTPEEHRRLTIEHNENRFKALKREDY